MKVIYSPTEDEAFNEYLVKLIKERLYKRSLFFECNYSLVNNHTKETTDFTASDIIKSIKCSGRLVYFSNKKLIKHVVYNLSQRFWYDEFANIQNTIHKIYLEYKRDIQEGTSHV